MTDRKRNVHSTSTTAHPLAGFGGPEFSARASNARAGINSSPSAVVYRNNPPSYGQEANTRGHSNELNNDLSRFFKGTVPTPRVSVFDPSTAATSMAGLHVLAGHQCWSEVITTAKHLLAQSDPSINEKDVNAYLLTAYIKLGQYREAETLAQEHKLSTPNLQTRVDDLPFNFLLSVAYLTHKSNQKKFAHVFLLDMAESLQERGRVEDYKRCILHSVSYYIEDGRCDLAANTLKRLILLHPMEYALWSLLGRIYLQMGDLRSAEACFRRSGDAPTEHHEEITQNTTLLLLAKGQYDPALELMSESKGKTTRADAANNYAICALHCGRIPVAVDALEGILAKDPMRFVNEPLLSNLWFLYTIHKAPTREHLALKKRLIESLLWNYAPSNTSGPTFS